MRTRRQRPSRIYLIGAVTVDLIMGPVAPWPQPGTETFVAHSELRAGGPAGNTALALKALGVPHHLVCNIGDDMFGAWLAASFGEAARLAKVSGRRRSRSHRASRGRAQFLHLARQPRSPDG